jgi:hypothetical protein
MSFSGWWQTICETGHYATLDPFTEDPCAFTCPICGKGAVWEHLVDTTNGPDEADEIKLKIKSEIKETCTCEKCGNIHTIKHEILYELPSKEVGHHIKPKRKEKK